MLTSAAILTAIGFATQVAAHGGVVSLDIGGKNYPGWLPYNTPVGQTTIERPWATYDPILDATASTLACNDDGTSGALQLTADAVAGQPITAHWNQVWPHNTGPMLTYLAKCPGTTCTGVNANGLSWFKIDQAGLLSGTIGNGTWGSGKMIAQNNSWTTTIPASVPSGPYLIRFETIALHSLPAQFYPECAQLNIINGGNVAPSSSQLVKFPGGYSNSDPGLTVNLYTQEAMTDSNYIIPGPPLYGSSGQQPTRPPTSSTTAQPTHPTTSNPPTTTSSPPPSQTQGGAHYSQCGGVGWSGPTTCVTPYTCQKQNDYYSQCL